MSEQVVILIQLPLQTIALLLPSHVVTTALGLFLTWFAIQTLLHKVWDTIDFQMIRYTLAQPMGLLFRDKPTLVCK